MDVSPHPACFSRKANHSTIIDRYMADVVCPFHQTHNLDYCICHFSQITQVTSLSLSNAEDASGISERIANSGKVLVLTSRPTTSPAGGPATDLGQFPTDPLAWVTWSVQVEARFVTAEGRHINRHPAIPMWENWTTAEAAHTLLTRQGGHRPPDNHCLQV